MRKLTGIITALLLFSTFLVGAAPATAAPPPPPTNAFLAKVLSLANQYRAENEAGPLVWNKTIAAGSQKWAVTINDRINAGKLDMNKIHRTDAGLSILPPKADMYSEIIAINTAAQQVVDWWMASPAHRNALLDKRATDIGAGYVVATKGNLKGQYVAVANLAGYAASRAVQPQPKPRPLIGQGDVAAVDTDGGLYIYASAKGEDLWKRKFASLGWGNAQQVEVVDYNSDGIQDVVAIWKSGALTVSYGQANGTLMPLKTIGAGWSALTIVASKWRTADKFPGLIAQQRSNGALYYYPNMDGSKFGARTQIGTGWGSLTIVGADVDGDKKADLLARNSAGALLLYRGNGTGGFISETRRQVATGFSTMTHLSGITNHLGQQEEGLLARDKAGNLIHYTLIKGVLGPKNQIGTGGWTPLLLGS